MFITISLSFLLLIITYYILQILEPLFLLFGSVCFVTVLGLFLLLYQLEFFSFFLLIIYMGGVLIFLLFIILFLRQGFKPQLIHLNQIILNYNFWLFLILLISFITLDQLNFIENLITIQIQTNFITVLTTTFKYCVTYFFYWVYYINLVSKNINIIMSNYLYEVIINHIEHISLILNLVYKNIYIFHNSFIINAKVILVIVFTMFGYMYMYNIITIFFLFKYLITLSYYSIVYAFNYMLYTTLSTILNWIQVFLWDLQTFNYSLALWLDTFVTDDLNREFNFQTINLWWLQELLIPFQNQVKIISLLLYTNYWVFLLYVGLTLILGIIGAKVYLKQN